MTPTPFFRPTSACAGLPPAWDWRATPPRSPDWLNGWRPWRAYALAHLWSVAGAAGPAAPTEEGAVTTLTSKGESAA